MSYGMHDYLVEKALQNQGMRKEANAFTTGAKAVHKGLSWLGGNLSKRVGNKMYTGSLKRALTDDMTLEDLAEVALDKRGRAGEFLMRNAKYIDPAIGTGAAGGIGTGTYFGGKALLAPKEAPAPAPEPSLMDRVKDFAGQYAGTAAGAFAGVPTAAIAALMSKDGNRLKNALLYGALASIIGAGAGFAYDKYRA